MNQKGFNLIELMVAIAIFGLIAGAVTSNLRGSSPNKEVQLQADNVSSLLRQAQVQSFAGEPFNGVTPTGGYGVYFTTCTAPPCSVTLFADFNNNFAYDIADEKVQDVPLGQYVTVKAISNGSPTAVVFKPPRPYICFNEVCSGIPQFSVTLGSTLVPKTVDVNVSQISGQISS